MADLFANDVATTLAAPVTTTGQTSITVASSAGFPAPAAGDQFRIRVGNEYMAVTAVSGTTWTVTRAVEGSTATTHSTGAAVTHVLTAGALAAAFVTTDAAGQTVAGRKTFRILPDFAPVGGYELSPAALTATSMRLYHDLVRFTSPVTESSPDGVTWSASGGGREVLDGRYDTGMTMPDTVRWFRWTFSGLAWASVTRLVMAFGYVGTGPAVTVTVESSADGSVWTSRGSATFANGSIRLYALDLADAGGDGTYRVTVQTTGGPAGSGNCIIRSMELQSARPGEQGLGPEAEEPFTWDVNRQMSFRNHVLPATDSAHDLGSTGQRWRDGFFSGSVTIGGQAAVRNADARLAHDPTDTVAVNGDFETTFNNFPVGWQDLGPANTAYLEAPFGRQSGSMGMTLVAGAQNAQIRTATPVPVTPGEVLNWSLHVMGTATRADGLYFRFLFHNSATALDVGGQGTTYIDALSNVGFDINPGRDYVGTVKVPAGYTYCQVYIYNTSQTYMGVDNVRVSRLPISARNSDRLGPRGAASSFADWNDCLEPGWYSSDAAANAPGTGWFLGTVETHDSNTNNRWVTQTLHQFTTSTSDDTKMYRRQCNNNTWGAWYRVRVSEAEQDARYARSVAARVATTENITLSGEQTIDGAAVNAGHIVLVKDQTETADNGVYVVATGAWTRLPGVGHGTLVHVGNTGLANIRTSWVFQNASSFTYRAVKIAPATPSGVPVGAMQMFAGSAAPSGYLLCDGSPVSRATYGDLYTALGGASSPWGQGDGSTTFNVPDMRARVPVGVGTGKALGATDGVAEVSRNANRTHSHGHGSSGSGSFSVTSGAGTQHAHGPGSYTAPSHTHGINTNTGGSTTAGSGTAVTLPTKAYVDGHTHGGNTLGPSLTQLSGGTSAMESSHTHSVSGGVSVSVSVSNNTTPESPFAAVNYIIKH